MQGLRGSGFDQSNAGKEFDFVRVFAVSTEQHGPLSIFRVHFTRSEPVIAMFQPALITLAAVHPDRPFIRTRGFGSDAGLFGL